MPLHDTQLLKQQVPLTEVLERHGIILKQHGRELIALCPFHGETTPSFTVEPEKGVGGLYYCHGCAEGGDAIKFLQTFLNVDAATAIRRMAEIAGGEPLTDIGAPRPRVEKTKAPEKADEWHCIPAPSVDEASPKTLRVERDGEWREFPVVRAWPYRNAAGELLAYDCRIEPEPGKKDIIPVTWRVNRSTGETRWKQGSLPKPRVLYGAELLAALPASQVLVVEGCKTADAARRLLAGFPVIVVSWMGGGKAVRFADWSALAGRKVVIWPDCDSQTDKNSGAFKPYAEQTGVAAALAIVEQLEAHGAKSRIVEVPTPGIWADGYDLADAEAEGRNQAWAVAYLRDHLRTTDEILAVRAPEPVREDESARGGQDDSQPVADQSRPPAESYDDYPPERGQTFEADGSGEPFRILGWDRITAYYLPDNSEQIIDLTASAHTKNNLIALAPLDYWETRFPSSKKGSQDGIDWTAAINALIQRSQKAGIYDPDLVRGRGAWWEDGRWAVHLGNRVIIDGKSYNLKQAPTRYVYEKSATMHIQFDDPLPSADAVKLVRVCERLRWLRPISGKLLAGWVFLAPICGAIDWRPHIWITGGAGSGKSTVMRHVIGRCLKGICLQVEGDTSEAGIRQSLVHDARPVVFDEFESDRRKAVDRVEDVLAMVTRASSESDAQLLKGSGDGKAQGFRTRAMFAFSSIAVNIKQFAAATRVTVLDLYGEPESEASLATYNLMLEELFATLTPEYIQRMQARAVHMIPTIRANARTFAEAAAVALKSRRMGDQIGTLLAGVYALHGSKLITREDAIAWIHKQNWDDVAEVADGKDEAQCLAHMLSYQMRIETNDGGVMRSFGELIQCAARHGENAKDHHVNWEDAAATLRRHGIRVEGDYAFSTVTFASNHRELKRVMKETAWESSYARALLRIGGAERQGPTKFGAVSCRGVKLPIAAVI